MTGATGGTGDRGPAIRRLLESEARHPVVVLLSGTAGAGRTRLVNRLLDQGCRWPVGLAVRFTRHGPRPLDGTARATPARAPENTQAVSAAPDAEAPPPDPGTALEELLSARTPTLLVVEDVHLAPEPVRLALRRLLELAPPGLRALLTFRPEELPLAGLPLGMAVEYPGDAEIVRFCLPPLTEDEVRALAEEALGEGRCEPRFTERLWRRGAGVPQVVVDLLRMLRDGDGPRRLTSLELDALPSPPRLAELVLGRLAALDERAWAMVSAAAVLDEPATVEELREVADLEPSAARAGLLAADRASVLGERGDGRCGFTVPVAASAVYEVVPGPVRREAHARAARVLARRQPVDWAALARHRRAGGQVRGLLRAVERAVEEASAAGEHQLAIRLLEETLEHSALPREQRTRLVLLLARNAVVGLRDDETVRVLRRLVADVFLPDQLRGEMRLELGLLLTSQAGLFEESRVQLARATEELRERPGLAARAMSSLAMPYWPGGTLAENLRWIERALAAAKESGDLVVQAAVQANRTAILVNIGDPDAWEEVERLPWDSEELACRQHAARGMCNSADGAVWIGWYERAYELLDRGRDLAARTGAAHAERTGWSTTLLLDWATGRWAGLVERARTQVNEAGEGSLAASDAQLVLGRIALARGEWVVVEQCLAPPSVLALSSGAVPLMAAASSLRIRLALARQDEESAAAEAEDAWARVREKGVWVWATELAPWAVEALIRVDRAGLAQEWVTEYRTEVAGRSAPNVAPALAMCRAMLAEGEGDPEAATRLFREAAAGYRTLPRPYDTALCLERAARCALEAEGAPPGAVGDDLAEAVELLDRLGASWDAARARAALRTRHQLEPRPPGRPGYGMELSPREREVATLAGGGLTNREIAATLHLSSRTVEQHVARALRKLGAESRQDLSRLTEQERTP
ncbi:LuxR C-terminal-related transcriptional regulator [Streptomyces sp. NPDC005438]|uniref:helix-turn-helix transcriptional regulator n=1 Tax=Streptomyces sp. NPDC005438 TaxID=3156880 RepID=UPI0033AEDC75